MNWKPLIGKRVQLHPATDEWMQGDRYGEIIAVTPSGRVLVKLDYSGRIRRFHPDNILEAV